MIRIEENKLLSARATSQKYFFAKIQNLHLFILIKIISLVKMSSSAKILAFLVLVLITSAENTESFNNLDEKTQNLAIDEFTSLPGGNFQMDDLRLSLNE